MDGSCRVCNCDGDILSGNDGQNEGNVLRAAVNAKAHTCQEFDERTMK